MKIKMAFLAVLSLFLLNEIHAQTSLKGTLWTAKKVKENYIVSVKDSASLLAALTDFVRSEHVRAGQITGIGAVNMATLRFFNPQTKKYVDSSFHEQMEMSNLSGNISEVLGVTTLHLHVTLGRKDYSALAGHQMKMLV